MNLLFTILKFKKVKLLKIDYNNVKRVVNKENVESLKKKTIKEILLLKKSEKYTKKDGDYNKKQLDPLIGKSKILDDLLGKNYLFLFKNIYFQKGGNRKVGLNFIGLNDKIIDIPEDIELYEQIFSAKDNDKYKEETEKIIEERYFNNNNEI